MRPYFWILGLALILHSCIYSIHPLHSPDTLVKKDLTGLWKDSNGNQFIFEPHDKGGLFWNLTYRESKNSSSEYLAALVQVGNYLYFDFYPQGGSRSTGSGLAYYLPTHNFMKVEFKEGGMLLYPFNSDFLKTLFDQRKIRIKHERTEDGNIVLTASTQELQQFFSKYGGESEAFLDSEPLKKVR